jgi:hypothetical protein
MPIESVSGRMAARSALFAVVVGLSSVLPAAARAEAPVTAAAAGGQPMTAPPAAAGDWRHQRQLSVMAGLAQWTLLRGGNVALEYKVGRLAFEVSHGQGLDLNQAGGFDLSSAERDAGVEIRVPWTTGFGVGYRLTGNLHVLIELKAHHYALTGRDPTVRLDYTTFSVGPGVFYTIHLYRGLFLEPNVRYWPNVGSTLKGDQVAIRQPDGSIYEHHAHDFGLFANVNLGYTF